MPGWGLAPSAKAGFDFTETVSRGVEYYRDYGAVRDFAPVHNQQEKVFAVADLNVSPRWKCNLGSAWAPPAQRTTSS